jgi:hypothetical protein
VSPCPAGNCRQKARYSVENWRRQGEGKRNICVNNRGNKFGIWKPVLKRNFDKPESEF